MTRSLSSGLILAAAMLLPRLALAQGEASFEIVVLGYDKTALRGKLIIVQTNSEEHDYADTDDKGVVVMPLAACKPQLRFVVQPADHRYYPSSDVRCPRTPQRMEVRLELRPSAVPRRGLPPAANHESGTFPASASPLPAKPLVGRPPLKM